MISNDIDLLEEITFKDPYYFALRLINLKKNKKANIKNIKNSHFKFLIEQQNYIIDQIPNKVENIFWIMRTSSISLNKQTLHFFVPDVKSSNTEFQLKIYLISHEEVQQIASMLINTLTYIEIFLEFGKNIFRQTVSLCLQYTLQYEIFIQKSKLQIQNLLKQNKDQNQNLKNAFKKKSDEIIQIQNQRAQVRNKNLYNRQNNLLRKSLHFNKNKLIQVKKLKKQLKDRSISKSISRSSFFMKIEEIFKPNKQFYGKNISIINKVTQGYQNKKQKMDSQKSYAVLPPQIGPHKYNRPHNKFYYHSLNIQRQKQRQRVKIYQNINKKQIETKQSSTCSLLNMLKVIIFILFISFVMYYLSSPSKTSKVKLFKKIDWFND